LGCRTCLAGTGIDAGIGTGTTITDLIISAIIITTVIIIIIIIIVICERFCGFRGQQRNECILNKPGVKRELLDTVKARKLAYYGHTVRKQGS